jgi:hypothetical protein
VIALIGLGIILVFVIAVLANAVRVLREYERRGVPARPPAGRRNGQPNNDRRPVTSAELLTGLHEYGSIPETTQLATRWISLAASRRVPTGSR